MAGGPYNIPRNTKGEGRFFYIFSTKALIVTAIFAVVGIAVSLIIYAVLLIARVRVSAALVCLIGAIIFGIFGFVISSLKIPDSNNFEITRKAGGEYLSDILFRIITFGSKKKIYVYNINRDVKNQKKEKEKVNLKLK